MDETTKPPEPETIFLVVGEDGAHSDHTSWSVAWYGAKELADAHAAALNVESEALTIEHGKRIRAHDAMPQVLEYPNPYRVKSALDPERSSVFASYSVATLNRGKWPFDLPPRGEVK